MEPMIKQAHWCKHPTPSGTPDRLRHDWCIVCGWHIMDHSPLGIWLMVWRAKRAAKAVTKKAQGARGAAVKDDQGYAVPHGPSIIETLNGLLDEACDDLVKAKGRHKAEDRYSGIVAGLAMAIAIMINPYEPNEDAVMAEAIERRKARQ